MAEIALATAEQVAAIKTTSTYGPYVVAFDSPDIATGFTLLDADGNPFAPPVGSQLLNVWVMSNDVWAGGGSQAELIIQTKEGDISFIEGVDVWLSPSTTPTARIPYPTTLAADSSYVPPLEITDAAWNPRVVVTDSAGPATSGEVEVFFSVAQAPPG